MNDDIYLFIVNVAAAGRTGKQLLYELSFAFINLESRFAFLIRFYFIFIFLCDQIFDFGKIEKIK